MSTKVSHETKPTQSKTSARLQQLTMSGFNPLAPLSPESILQEKSVLVFQDKFWSLTDNSAKVQDADGNVLYSIEGKWSLHGKRTVTDATGKELAKMRKKKFMDLLRQTSYLGTDADEKIVTVKATDLKNLKTKNATFYRGTSDEKIGKVEGGFLAKDLKISIGDKVVAEVEREWLKPAAFVGVDTFPISIEAGVDRLFVAMLVMVYNNMYTNYQ